MRGVYLIWEEEAESRSSLLKFDYRIYRREKGSSKRVAVPFLRAVVHTREGERWTGVDMGIEWEKTYLYSVTPVTRVYSQEGHLIAEIEGDDSAPLEIITHNVFAPAVPERLLPVVGHIPGKKFVDLLWAPNTEKDISGYNVYRREENGQPVPINSVPITMVSFQDVNVWPGTSTSTVFPRLTFMETRAPGRRKQPRWSPKDCASLRSTLSKRTRTNRYTITARAGATRKL